MNIQDQPQDFRKSKSQFERALSYISPHLLSYISPHLLSYISGFKKFSASHFLKHISARPCTGTPFPACHPFR